ncbi:hypothetical protein CEXT_262691 [Caerostris extrusa]|uniref:Uncharacterized protein n=1 Tax=Caerostris extrusa TaxID=172846 RepID=A0AAV4QT00_CAEEX|nr:hypothetical protein CEXT_262691 [Caerostris extrusa]
MNITPRLTSIVSLSEEGFTQILLLDLVSGNWNSPFLFREQKMSQKDFNSICGMKPNMHKTSLQPIPNLQQLATQALEGSATQSGTHVTCHLTTTPPDSSPPLCHESSPSLFLPSIFFSLVSTCSKWNRGAGAVLSTQSSPGNVVIISGCPYLDRVTTSCCPYLNGTTTRCCHYQDEVTARCCPYLDGVTIRYCSYLDGVATTCCPPLDRVTTSCCPHLNGVKSDVVLT